MSNKKNKNGRTFWDFLSELFENLCIMLVLIICTPFGWVGLTILSLLIPGNLP